MKKRIYVRLLSLLLCLVMMFTCLQSSATALTIEDVQQTFNKLAYYTVSNLPDGLKERLNNGWSKTTLDKMDAEQTNLLTTVSPDGTKTLYSYDTPIKYVDDEGYVRFIDSSLKPCIKADGLFDWYSYENTANNVKTYFPLFINTGVLIEDDNFSIRMTPDGKNSMVGRDGDYVQYEDVFGQGVDIRYTAINTGVKEDIVIAQYNGDNTFEYIVETEGLVPIRTAGKTVEFYDYSLNLSYTFGEIVMFDADNKTATENSYTVEELEDGKYLVTLIVDEEFLTADDTAYPVVVDPTVVTSTEHSQQFKATTYHSSGSISTNENKIVCTESGSTAITHLQMTDLTAFAHINPKEITDVTLNLSFSDFNTYGMVYANGYNFDTDPSVTGESLSWSSVSARCTAQTESVAQVGSQTQIHIKDIFREWLTAYTKYYSRENTVSAEDGLFLYSLASSGTMDATLCSPGSDNAPSVVVRYTVGNTLLESGYYYIQSGYYYDDARYMTATSSGAVLGDRNYDDPNQIWYVQRLDELYNNTGYMGQYFIYSVGTVCNDYLASRGTESITWRGEAFAPTGIDGETNFYIVDQDNGYHRILTDSKKAVAVKYYSKENGAQIIHQQVKGLDNQRWKFEPARYGVFAKGETTIDGVVGENVPFEYSLVPINAKYKISVDPDIAELVSSNNSLAYVKCLAPGTTDITVSFSVRNNVTGKDEPYSCTWRLNTYKLSLSNTNINLEWTKTAHITASSDGMPIEWSSSDDSIVTVDAGGNIEAVGIGVATITAKITGTNVYKTCTVSTMPTYSESQLDIPYVETDSEEINCYGFAIGCDEIIAPGHKLSPSFSYKGWNDLDQTMAYLMKDFELLDRSIRIISGPNDKLYSFEYRIALRVTTNKNEYKGKDNYYDFHFMKETNGSIWADKHGEYTSKSHSVGTPETISWNITDNENDEQHETQYIYDSDIIYFAISL